jgi:hypothetical protein
MSTTTRDQREVETASAASKRRKLAGHATNEDKAELGGRNGHTPEQRDRPCLGPEVGFTPLRPFTR